MSGLLGGGQPKVIPEFTGLQVNTSVQVLPVPIIYGAPRVNTNLIYYNGFNVQKISVGGKGILGGGKGSQQIEYFATIIMAIGEGVISDVLIIYEDQAVYTPANFPTNGSAFFTGTDTQTPWSYIETNWPPDARGYKDTVYYGFPNAELDSSATVPQINLVPFGLLAGTSPLNNSTITITSGQYDKNGNPISTIGAIPLGCVDADPGQVIYDFLTNSRYGAGFPANLVSAWTLLSSVEAYDPNSGDTAISTYCQAVGLAWSVVLNNAESANTILERWTKNMNVAPVWNGEVLRFIPYWDRYAGANPNWDPSTGIPKKYFAPFTTPITSITIDQIIRSEGSGEDPITFVRKNPMEVYNTVRLDFKDRTNFFNDVPAEAKDEAHIELYGPRVDNIGLGSEYTLLAYAQAAVNILLRRNITVMRTFTFKLNPLWGFLDPMDLVQIPDPTNWNSTIVVRVISAEDDENEVVTITAEEYPLGSQSPTVMPGSPTTPPNQGPTNLQSLPVYAPVIFEPTTAMLTATGFASPQVVVGATSQTGIFDGTFGGCNIWISLDDKNYEEIGKINGPSLVGQLAAPLPGYIGTNPDNTHTLSVDLSLSGGSLATYPPSGAASGASLCLVKDMSGFELISYQTATLASADTYNLTGLYRGLYGTTSRLFGLGSQFLFLGTKGNFFETALPPQYVGKTFYVKLQVFNAFNNYTQPLEDCYAYEYVATGPTPAGPTTPLIVPQRRPITAPTTLLKPRRPRGLM